MGPRRSCLVPRRLVLAPGCSERHCWAGSAGWHAGGSRTLTLPVDSVGVGCRVNVSEDVQWFCSVVCGAGDPCPRPVHPQRPSPSHLCDQRSHWADGHPEAQPSTVAGSTSTAFGAGPGLCAEPCHRECSAFSVIAALLATPIPNHPLFEQNWVPGNSSQLPAPTRPGQQAASNLSLGPGGGTGRCVPNNAACLAPHTGDAG